MQKLYNIIPKRRSIRTFLKQALTTDEVIRLQKMLEKLTDYETPYKTKINAVLINQMSGESEKIGTYGFVKNASAFIAGDINNRLEEIIDYGYIFELIVLTLVQEDFGSVWLGGTFNRSSVARNLTTSKLVPGVLAIGYPSDQSLTEKTIRFVVKASNRKPLNEIVINYNTNLSQPLLDVLEALRIAPSGSNQQPWRIMLTAEGFNLILKRTPNYAKELNYEVQGLDIGIAIAHLNIALKHFNINFELITNQNLDLTSPETLVCSYKIKKPD